MYSNKKVKRRSCVGKAAVITRLEQADRAVRSRSCRWNDWRRCFANFIGTINYPLFASSSTTTPELISAFSRVFVGRPGDRRREVILEGESSDEKHRCRLAIDNKHETKSCYCPVLYRQEPEKKNI